jgi:hypothetical protein
MCTAILSDPLRSFVSHSGRVGHLSPDRSTFCIFKSSQATVSKGFQRYPVKGLVPLKISRAQYHSRFLVVHSASKKLYVNNHRNSKHHQLRNV